MLHSNNVYQTFLVRKTRENDTNWLRVQSVRMGNIQDLIHASQKWIRISTKLGVREQSLGQNTTKEEKHFKGLPWSYHQRPCGQAGSATNQDSQ